MPSVNSHEKKKNLDLNRPQWDAEPLIFSPASAPIPATSFYYAKTLKRVCATFVITVNSQ